jgi:hypothetical protein
VKSSSFKMPASGQGEAGRLKGCAIRRSRGIAVHGVSSLVLKRNWSSDLVHMNGTWKILVRPSAARRAPAKIPEGKTYRIFFQIFGEKSGKFGEKSGFVTKSQTFCSNSVEMDVESKCENESPQHVHNVPEFLGRRSGEEPLDTLQKSLAFSVK